MAYYVYSTMSGGVNYNGFEPLPGGGQKISKTVTINGGANLAQKDTFYTPKGSVTKVSDEDVEFLKQNKTFQIHLNEGHVKIEKVKKEIDKAVEDMEERDGSAPRSDKQIAEMKEKLAKAR